jgi:hypothetical protein
MRRVVEEADVPFLDGHRLLEGRSRHGILGGPILCDRVHPSFEGNQWIADELVCHMAELVSSPSSPWEQRAKQSYKRHFRVDAHYFLKGQRTIEAVERWTRGETNGPPIERAPHRIATPTDQNCSLHFDRLLLPPLSAGGTILQRWKITKKTGTKKTARIVDASILPNTAVPSAC